MVSAVFTINGQAVPNATAQKTTAGATVTVQLASTLGVQKVDWSFHGVFPSSTVLPTFAIDGSASPYGSKATFTVPSPVDGYGLALLITCTVNNGLTGGRPDSNLVYKSKVWVPDAVGFAPFAAGETLEMDVTDGWTDELNHRITGAATGGVSVVANGDVTGAINANTVVKIQGRSVNAVAPSNGQVLGWDAADGYWKPVNQTGGGSSQTLSQTLALGNATDGYNIVVSNGDAVSGADGYDLNLITASMSNASAGNVAVTGGQSIDSGTGNINYGALVTVGGGAYPGGESSGSGGNITISAGSGNIAGSTGGSVTITANTGTGGDGIIDIAAVGGVEIRSVNDAIYMLTNNTQRLIVANTITIPGFAGSGTKILQVDNSGVVGLSSTGGFTAGGDLSGSSSSQQVISITGSSGAVNIASTGNIITWDTATTAPGIKQANNITNSATGQTLTVQAQNATGTSATGGTLNLTSGTGTSAAGPVHIQTGGTNRITALATGVVQINNLSTGLVHADSSGNLTSSTLVNADVASAAAIAVSKLAAGTSAQVLLNNSTPTPTWTSISGDVSLTNAGATSVVSLTGSAGAINIASTGNILTWNTATTAPGIKQANNTTNSATAATMTIQAANATGTSATGGALNLTSGTGTSAAGAVNLQIGGTTKLGISSTGAVTLAALGTGIVHSSSAGLLSSSTIVDADVSSSAAIAVSKLAQASTDGYLLQTVSGVPTWVIPRSIGLELSTYSEDGYTTTNSTAGVVKTIALSDNTFYRITWEYIARDTGSNLYKKKSSTDWYRAAGGSATQLGIEDGPAAVDNITCTGASIAGSSNNVQISFGGSGSVHTSGYLLCWVYSHALAAAT